MDLIITEKPSVARDFSKALDAAPKEGYYEGPRAVITYAVGHLLELYMPEEYDERYKEWKTEDLPIVPQKYLYHTKEDTKKQFKKIEKLVTTRTWDRVIIATDAGREGELIGRLILHQVGFRDWNKTFRFWMSEALTGAAIRKGLAVVRPIRNYDQIFAAGYYRSIADWLVGINMSRYYSIRMGGTFPFGRVQTTVLRILVDRERAIKNFKPEPYMELTVDGELRFRRFKLFLKNTETKTRRFDDKAYLQQVIAHIQKTRQGVVTKAKSEVKKELPPQLLNLTALQQIANRRYGYSADQTLKAAQALYETHKCLSYPRTPSRVMGSSDVPAITKAVAEFRKYAPQLAGVINTKNITHKNTRVFNDAKLEDHHALIPYSLPPKAASTMEKNVWVIVAEYFAMAFGDVAEWRHTAIEVTSGQYVFEAKGRQLATEGWRAGKRSKKDEENEDEEDPIVPYGEEGEIVPLSNPEILQKQTKPPKRYTESALLGAMERPARFLEKDDIKFPANTGVGTPATRAATIEGLVHRSLIERKAKQVVPTGKGDSFVSVIERNEKAKDFTSVVTTAQWEHELSTSPREFYEATIQSIRSLIASLNQSEIKPYENNREAVGKCPKCGADVYEGKKTFFCKRSKEDACDFRIWKEIAGGKVSRSAAQALLKNQKTRVISFVSKKGKPFKAKLEMGSDGRPAFVFDNTKQATKRKAG